MYKPPKDTTTLDHPMTAVMTENEGLNQMTEIHYTLDENGNRIPTAQGKVMRRRMKMKLPLSFSPEVWHRHEYSLSDVIHTLDCFLSRHLWQLALMLGIPLSNSSVKLSFSSPTAMVFSSKAIVLIKIGQQLEKFYSFPERDVLDKNHDEHVPPLPIHRIDASDYQLWKSRTPKSRNDITILQTNVIDHVFHWKGIMMVPMWMESDCIYMMRVVTDETLINSKREHDSLATRPFCFDYKGQRLWGLCDEASFFLPRY